MGKFGKEVLSMDCYKNIIEKLRCEYSDRIALMEVDDERNLRKYSYERFVKDIRKAATYIMQNEYNDQVVAIIGNKSYQWLVCAYACLYTDTAIFPIDPNLEKTELLDMCKKVGSKLILADDVFIEDFVGELQELHMVSMNDALDMEDQIDRFDIKIDENKVICYMSSSGTTGRQKIAMFSHKNLMAPIRRGWPKVVAKDGRRMMWTLPFFHVGFLSLLCLFMGGNTLCVGRSPKYYFRDMKVFDFHELTMVPMLLDAVIRKMERGQAIQEIIGNQCTCISCGAAPLRSDHIKMINDSGIYVVNNYGMTETSGLGTINILSKDNISKNESVGNINGHMEIAIKDGEIIMRGDGVMLGYYGDEKATEETIRDGWLYTGDLGYIDEDGFLYIKGRKKNVIITSSGENVLPEEIENVFIKQGIAEEVCVYSKHNVITAEFYIGSKRTDKNLVKDAVKKYNADTPASKNIRNIIFNEVGFEKTATGKIIREKSEIF